MVRTETKLWQKAGILVLAMAFVLSATSFAQAEAEESAVTLAEALKSGKVNFSLRLRGEAVSQDGMVGSEAFTSRVRVGYETAPFLGFSGYVELEDIRTTDDDRYFDGVGANTSNKATIADPEDSELNQAYLKYAQKGFTFIGGRQRIILDDSRFVGNVGWRQNEQTFDATTLIISPIEDLKFTYSYIWDVNRIFGPDADKDFESDSHILNLACLGCPLGELVAFAYLLDFDDSPMNSSNTYGLRHSGSNVIVDGLSLDHALSYAYQTSSDENTSAYNASYYLGELGVTAKNVGSFGAGYEVLGSNNHASFQTPLATLHGKNGWADAFLTTPADGLDDVYVFAGTTLPCGTKAKVLHHWFSEESQGEDLGEELDIVFSKALSEDVTALIKYAEFNGRSGYADRCKVWLQMEYSF